MRVRLDPGAEVDPPHFAPFAALPTTAAEAVAFGCATDQDLH